MSRRWTRFLLPAALLVGAALAYRRAHVRTSATPRSSASVPAPSATTSASASAVPLLGGLKPGDVLDEWAVTRIVVTRSPTDQPQLAIDLERKGSGITVWVGRKEAVDNPPVSTDRYALTYGHARPYGEPIPEDAYTKMTAAVADRVRTNEHKAPLPAGL